MVWLLSSRSPSPSGSSAARRARRCRLYTYLPMFSARFSDPPPGGRPDLSFRLELTGTRDLKDEWAFIWDDALRSNIAATLQDVEFDIHLVNQYNVFWTPLTMKYKHAIVQVASVAEAVIDYMLRMVEDDPRVQKALGSRWTLRDWSKVPTPGIEVGEGVRVVSGTQEQIQNVLDRNTKMQLLIRAAKAVGILDEALAKEIDDLRDLRNRIHIKTLTDPEYNGYTAKMANDALNTLVRFRAVALAWTVQKRSDDLRQPVEASDDFAEQAHVQSVPFVPDFPPAPFEVAVSADDDIDFGPPLVTGPPEPEAPDFGPPDDDIPW